MKTFISNCDVVVFKDPAKDSAGLMMFLIFVSVIAIFVAIVAISAWLSNRKNKIPTTLNETIETTSNTEKPSKETIKKCIIIGSIITIIIIGIIVLIATLNNSSKGFTYIEKNDGTYKVKSYTGNEVYVEIPTTFKNKPITEISSNAFQGKNKIKTLVVPESITKIEPAAFNGCTSLETITLPFIGSTPYYNTYLTFLFSWQGTGQEQTVPASLKTIYLSESCTQIKQHAFQNCPNITEIHIPKSVVIIEAIYNNEASRPFYGCSSELEIYCESPQRPEKWSPYWANISDQETAKVHWGYK